MNEWAKELSESLKDFRGRLLAEEIKHQYYENLLNKVDTAVLVTEDVYKRQALDIRTIIYQLIYR